MRPGDRVGRASTSAFRAVAGRPDVVRLELAWVASITSVWAVTIGLLAVAYDEGGSGAVAVAVLAGRVPSALLGPLIGRLVDRFPKRASLSVASAVCAVAAGGAAGAGGALVPVVVLTAVVSVGHVVVRAATWSALPALVDEAPALTAANVVANAAEAVGVFLGPAMAGLLLSLQGPALAFGAAAALFGLAALLCSRLPAGPARRQRPAGSGARQRLAGLPALRLVLLLVLAQTVVSGGLVVLYPALAVDGLDASIGVVGLLTAVYGLGGVLGSLGLFALAGSSRLGAATAGSLLLWGLPLTLLPVAPVVVGAAVVLAVVGAANVVFDVATVTLTQRSVPAEQLGRAFGVFETTVGAGLGVGTLLAPWLDDLVGPTGALALLGGALAVAALLAALPLTRLDGELRAPARQVALLRGLAPFALLPVPALERLALALVRVEVPAGAVVTRQGERGSDYLLVDEGELDVAVDGRAVATLQPGDGFGEVALLREGVRTATVTARAGTRLWSLDGGTFLEAMGTGSLRQAAELVAAERLDRAAPAVRRPAEERHGE